MTCKHFLRDDAEPVIAVAKRLCGESDPEQVIPATLAELAAVRPGVTWVLFQRQAGGSLRAHSPRRLAASDLVTLARAACGADAEIEVDSSRIAAIPYDQEAAWQSHPRDTRSPELVLAAFSDPGEETVAGDTLSTLLELVVGAMARARELAELRQQSAIDPLTGVKNRRAVLELAEREQARARRHHAPFSVLFIDVDHFKAINDRHGHRVGDQALVSLAATLGRVLRRTDTVGRVGGDEFLVLLPHTGPRAAARVARSLAALCAATEVVLEGVRLHLDVTIGVASLGEETDDLIDLADQRMLRDKRRRDGVTGRSPGAGRSAA
jgi:diguanylate cyclase (GGDEF)-like protein